VLRSPHLYRSLRLFCLAAFAHLSRGEERGEPIEFAFEEHSTPGRPALYEYRPLVRGYVEARAAELEKLADARLAIEELAREPAASIFARAHAGPKPSAETSLFRTIALAVVIDVAETCGGFDWDDRVFDRIYLAVERSLFGERHAYGAVAPLVGLTVGSAVELGHGVRVRAAAAGELAAHWPEAKGLLPPGFGREPERSCVLELERELERGAADAPDAPAELADAVTALRLATPGPIAAGPVLFERLDWRPYGIRPVLPIAATEPPGEPTRVDSFRGQLARDLLERLGAADEDLELGDALDRWELSLFQGEPFRSEQLRQSLCALLGGSDGLFAASLRLCVLLGETGAERTALLTRLRAGTPEPDDVRRGLVEVLVHGDREALIERLDESLLGVSPRPPGYFALRAAGS